MKSINNFKKMAGFTLIELMIGLLVGFIVVGGILTIYSSTVSSSASLTSSARLNQELNAAMQLMVNEIRRAGYWKDTDNSDPTDNNPFTSSAYGYNVNIGATTGGQTCITYAYDLNQDSIVGVGSLTPGTDKQPLTTDTPPGTGTLIRNSANMEIFGFRYDSTNEALEMRSGGSAGESFNCDSGTWGDVTDPDVVSITALTIDSENTRCVNTSILTVPNDWTTTNDGSTLTTSFCRETNNALRTPSTGTTDVAVAATDNIAEVRHVNITLTGELAADATVTKSITRTVRIRNNVAVTGLTIAVP